MSHWPRRQVGGALLGAEASPSGVWRHFTPPQFFVAFFILLLTLGTLGLRWLAGLYVGPRLGWLDALFTATSAVCVVGLHVVNTATHFTFAGQAFVLQLIQVGGLGMITLTTLIIVTHGVGSNLRSDDR
ncbi:MAG: hypothetical protein GEU90_02500 [Gemmatimonas sp.]|nr:hypothetical protein [Gemmatimonas sp.]